MCEGTLAGCFFLLFSVSTTLLLPLTILMLLLHNFSLCVFELYVYILRTMMIDLNILNGLLGVQYCHFLIQIAQRNSYISLPLFVLVGYFSGLFPVPYRLCDFKLEWSLGHSLFHFTYSINKKEIRSYFLWVICIFLLHYKVSMRMLMLHSLYLFWVVHGYCLWLLQYIMRIEGKK